MGNNICTDSSNISPDGFAKLRDIFERDKEKYLERIQECERQSFNAARDLSTLARSRQEDENSRSKQNGRCDDRQKGNSSDLHNEGSNFAFYNHHICVFSTNLTCLDSFSKIRSNNGNRRLPLHVRCTAYAIGQNGGEKILPSCAAVETAATNPVTLSERKENNFSIQVDSTASYVVFHIQRTELTQVCSPKGEEYPIPSEELMNYIKVSESCFTPRGISLAFSTDENALRRGKRHIVPCLPPSTGGSHARKHHLALSPKTFCVTSHSKLYVYSYRIYVFNGIHAPALVVAFNVAKAFLLEKLAFDTDAFLAFLFYNLGTSGRPMPLAPVAADVGTGEKCGSFSDSLALLRGGPLQFDTVKNKGKIPGMEDTNQERSEGYVTDGTGSSSSFPKRSGGAALRSLTRLLTSPMISQTITTTNGTSRGREVVGMEQVGSGSAFRNDWGSLRQGCNLKDEQTLLRLYRDHVLLRAYYNMQTPITQHVNAKGLVTSPKASDTKEMLLPACARARAVVRIVSDNTEYFAMPCLDLMKADKYKHSSRVSEHSNSILNRRPHSEASVRTVGSSAAVTHRDSRGIADAVGTSTDTQGNLTFSGRRGVRGSRTMSLHRLPKESKKKEEYRASSTAYATGDIGEGGGEEERGGCGRFSSQDYESRRDGEESEENGEMLSTPSVHRFNTDSQPQACVIDLDNDLAALDVDMDDLGDLRLQTETILSGSECRSKVESSSSEEIRRRNLLESTGIDTAGTLVAVAADAVFFSTKQSVGHKAVPLTKLSFAKVNDGKDGKGTYGCDEFPDDRRRRLNELMPVASQIMPYLYVGGEAVSSDEKQLLNLGITTIVNAGAVTVSNFFPDEFEYVTLYICDSPDEDIEAMFPFVNKAIEKARIAGGGTLIHCHQGVSRSTTLVIAYLMWKFGWSLDYALKYTKDRRSIISPNSGFLVRLMLYENLLTTPPRRLVSAYMPFSRMYPLPFVFRIAVPLTTSVDEDSKTVNAEFTLDVRACYVALDRRPLEERTDKNVTMEHSSSELSSSTAFDQRSILAALRNCTEANSATTSIAKKIYFPDHEVHPGKDDVYRVDFLCGSQCSRTIADDAYQVLKDVLEYCFFSRAKHPEACGQASTAGSVLTTTRSVNGSCKKEALVFPCIDFVINKPIFMQDATTTNAEWGREGAGRNKVKEEMVCNMFADIFYPLTCQRNANGESISVEVLIGRHGQNDHTLATDVTYLYSDMLAQRCPHEASAERRKKRRTEALEEIRKNDATATTAIEQGPDIKGYNADSMTMRREGDGGIENAASDVFSLPVKSESPLFGFDFNHKNTMALGAGYVLGFTYPFDAEKDAIEDFIDICDLETDNVYAILTRTNQTTVATESGNGGDKIGMVGVSGVGDFCSFSAMGCTRQKKMYKLYLWRGEKAVSQHSWEEIHETLKKSTLYNMPVSMKVKVSDLLVENVEEGSESEDLALL